ncbi:MAG: response regulator transcription factor [Bacteroidota bacterium]
MEQSLHILLLEDDHSFGYILSEYLDLQGFQVSWAKSAEEAINLLEDHLFQLAILDIMLPGLDGFGFAKLLHQKHEQLPFIFLSAKSLKIDMLKGYKIGAYDFITKPVDEELLVAKIHALLRQTQVQKSLPEKISIGKYTFIPAQFQLSCEGEITKLTAREAELLKLLCQHKGELTSRKIALHQIWGATDEFTRKSMDVFVSRLRKYLSKDSQVRIENVHGQGFILFDK